jgi:hypothetical protein
LKFLDRLLEVGLRQNGAKILQAHAQKCAREPEAGTSLTASFNWVTASVLWPPYHKATSRL